MRSFGAVWQEYMDIRCGAKVAQQNRRFKGINTGGRERQEGGLRRFVREGRNRASERASERTSPRCAVCQQQQQPGDGRRRGESTGSPPCCGPSSFPFLSPPPAFQGAFECKR